MNQILEVALESLGGVERIGEVVCLGLEWLGGLICLGLVIVCCVGLISAPKFRRKEKR